MTNNQFTKFIKNFRRKQDELISRKGHDYTIGNKDRLFNFKFVAELIGITPAQVAAVYWLKHILAILTYVKFGKVESEDIDSRFFDESNYNALMRAVFYDQNKTRKNKSKSLKKKMS